MKPNFKIKGSEPKIKGPELKIKDQDPRTIPCVLNSRPSSVAQATAYSS